MKLNLFASWASLFSVFVTAFCLGAFLVAAGSGHAGWALIAALAGVGVLGLAISLYIGTVRHAHRMHQEGPHLF
ncbi:small-conductance mechanosensitive channel [Rhodococcus sp. 27YEA15]|uniref:hypothetical protein n=1 Tax=Rhodococcus sp. 27YEA15 TaxID=3156259 RepID=UPI003C7CEDA6